MIFFNLSNFNFRKPLCSTQLFEMKKTDSSDSCAAQSEESTIIASESSSRQLQGVVRGHFLRRHIRHRCQ